MPRPLRTVRAPKRFTYDEDWFKEAERLEKEDKDETTDTEEDCSEDTEMDSEDAAFIASDDMTETEEVGSEIFVSEDMSAEESEDYSVGSEIDESDTD